MDVISNNNEIEFITNIDEKNQDVQQAQDNIYSFLLGLIKHNTPEKVLHEFKHLFIYYEAKESNAKAMLELSKIILFNDEDLFKNTLKRACYILINNWESSRNYKYIKELVDLFLDSKISRTTASPSLSRLRKWITNFVESKDYQELQIFASRYDDRTKDHWSQRYTSYLLVPQSADINNSVEQRDAARTLSKKLKDKFKFDLAMYTVRSQSFAGKHNLPQNPTSLGDDVLRIIKNIIGIQGKFSHANLANLFINQTEKIRYKDFNSCLIKYLIFHISDPKFREVLKDKLSEKLNYLYEDYHEDLLDDALLLRTCNHVIEYVTTENKHEPSSLFILLVSQGSPLNLVLVLLKIILICQNARVHLETCIAALIEYYRQLPEEECKWIVNFMEVFNITFAVYAENIQYNLINMNNKIGNKQLDGDLQNYRVFAQLKSNTNLELPMETLVEIFGSRCILS